MTTNQKNLIGIYKINTERPFFKEKKLDEVFDYIVGEYNRKKPDSKFFQEEINEDESLFKDFKVKIFVSKKVSTPSWVTFISGVLKESDSFSKVTKNINFSYICFVAINENLFAVVGGNGYFLIRDYIDQNFGIKLLAKIVTKSDLILNSVQERSVTGAVLGSTKHFRNDYRLIDDDNFGKIYNKINAKIDSGVFEKFFGLLNAKKKSSCLAKDSFQFGKTIDFNELLTLIGKANTLLNTEDILDLNGMELIKKQSSNSQLIKSLKGKIVADIFELYKNNSELNNFDICSKDFDKYLTAESYVVFFKEKVTFDHAPNLNEILDAFNDKIYSSSPNEIDLYTFFEKCHIKSLDSNGDELTRDCLFENLNGEVSVLNSNYFLLGNNWYSIKDDFVDDLNNDLREILDSSQVDSLLPTITGSGEEEIYISKYFGLSDWFVLHKVLVDGIELCDLLFAKNNEVYLVHVKKNFNNSVRDLSLQMTQAAKRLQSDIKTGGFQFLNTVQSRIISKSSNTYQKNRSSQKLKKNLLKSYFKNKGVKIYFCAVILHKDKTKIVDSIKKRRSNIAKMSLVNAYREIRALNYEFRFSQVEWN